MARHQSFPSTQVFLVSTIFYPSFTFREAVLFGHPSPTTPTDPQTPGPKKTPCGTCVEALSFWLGFWIALIGLPNYALTARKLIYGAVMWDGIGPWLGGTFGLCFGWMKMASIFVPRFGKKPFTFGKTGPHKSDFAFNSCVVHIRRKETASGDTEQTQKLLEAREMEWEARLKKKGMPLVTSFGGAKMFLSRCVETQHSLYPCVKGCFWMNELG